MKHFFKGLMSSLNPIIIYNIIGTRKKIVGINLENTKNKETKKSMRELNKPKKEKNIKMKKKNLKKNRKKDK